MSGRSRPNRLRPLGADQPGDLLPRRGEARTFRWISRATPQIATAATRIWKVVDTSGRHPGTRLGDGQRRDQDHGHDRPAQPPPEQEDRHHGQVDEQATGILTDGQVSDGGQGVAAPVKLARTASDRRPPRWRSLRFMPNVTTYTEAKAASVARPA